MSGRREILRHPNCVRRMALQSFSGVIGEIDGGVLNVATCGLRLFGDVRNWLHPCRLMVSGSGFIHGAFLFDFYTKNSCKLRCRELVAQRKIGTRIRTLKTC